MNSALHVALLLVAAILAAIDLSRTKLQSLLAWAVLLIALSFLIFTVIR